MQAEKGHAPRPANKEDADHLIELTKAINEQMAEAARANLDEAVVRKLAHSATGELNPMAAMFGGIMGQEVVKAVSGKVGVGSSHWTGWGEGQRLCGSTQYFCARPL